MSQPGVPIKVLVVEDDDGLRAEFVAMIAAAEDMVLAGAAESLSAGRAAVAARGAPDVAIIDLGLPDGDGTALIGELAAAAPETNALVITVFGDEDHVVRALEAGAKGYLLKDVTPEEFARAVRLVQAGGAPLSPMIARYVLKRFALPRQPVQPPPKTNAGLYIEDLTARESEILQLIAEGHSVAEAAAALGLSPHTVNSHVKRIYGKLAVNNRVQAVNRARATGRLN